MQPNSNSSLAIPFAIVAGFALIAVAIFFTGNNKASPKEQVTTKTDPTATQPNVVRPIDSTDHIRGNPNAPIMIVLSVKYLMKP